MFLQTFNCYFYVINGILRVSAESALQLLLIFYDVAFIWEIKCIRSLCMYAAET